MLALGLALAAVCGGVLYYIYDGYGRVLQVLARRAGDGDSGSEAPGDEVSAWPAITVILPVFNEEARLAGKLKNILEQDYPDGKLEVLVVNDGSSDGSAAIVEQFAAAGVRLVETPGRVGKSLAQNIGVEKSSGSVLVLTDAALSMEPDCLKALVGPFADAHVGATTGNVRWRDDPDSDVGESQGYFWRYETKLRSLESNVGWLAVASGALMAVRRELWVDLEAWYGDDCVIPLDVVLQGRRVVHVANAVGTDDSFKTVRQEFRARVRMTVRNWQGTFARRKLLGPAFDIRVAFSLWSHKILRWLSPMFILGLGLGCFLTLMGGVSWPFVLYCVGLLSAALGACLLLQGINVRGLALLGNFFVVNVAFAIGIWRAVSGQYVRIYQNTGATDGRS